jgi:hypothetical protein
VLGRLDCAAELGAPATRRSSSSARARACSCGRPDAAAGRAARPSREPRRRRRDRPAGALRRRGAPTLPPLAPALAPIQALPEPPLHDVRRLSYSALALFERCSYRYYAERVAGCARTRARDRRRADGLVATEVGDAVHRLLELVDLVAPAAPDVEQVRAWYPAVTDDELARIAAFVDTNTAAPSWAQRIATLSGARPERPLRSSTTACFCTGDSTSSPSRAHTARAGLQENSLDERGHPTRSSRLTTGSSDSSTRLACFPSGVDEVEVVYHFLETAGCGCLEDVRACDLPELEASSRRRSAASAPASSFRLRASSTARAALRSTSSVQGPACTAARADRPHWRGGLMRVARLCDVHGNLPALEAVLAEVASLDVDRIVCGGDVIAGPFPQDCLDRLREVEAVFVRGNADRESPRRPRAPGSGSSAQTRRAVARVPARRCRCRCRSTASSTATVRRATTTRS